MATQIEFSDKQINFLDDVLASNTLPDLIRDKDSNCSLSRKELIDLYEKFSDMKWGGN